MTSEDWERLKALFEEALAAESPAEQRNFLDQSCRGDAVLRSELESLLAEHSRMNAAFLEQAPAELHAQLDGPREGSLLGAYRLERQLGRGGMGTVYLASRADGAYEKQVAIKLLSAVGTSEELIRRFLAERQILARLDHPNIARLIDGGTTEQGQPYLVMDYVEGIPIDRYCRERSLPLDRRLELFGRVCEAVAYANERMVVHRDIKPTNILVTADGTPKLLDFGIAKVLRPDSESLEARTLLLWGTPEYASPEQLSGRAISTATDVYSLGVLLYELLTDRSPYGLAKRAVNEMVRMICEEDPEPPSQAVTRGSSVQTAVPVEVPSEESRQRSKRLRGDLDNIVMMALRKEPEQRYQSASEFVQDIQRYAQGLPIQGRARTWVYRSSKYVRRYRAAIGLASLVAVAIITVLEVAKRPQNGPNGETLDRRVWAGEADSVSSDGRLLAISGTDYVILRDWQTGEEQRIPADGSTSSAIFSRDGRSLAYAVQPDGENPPPMEARIVNADGTARRTVFRATGVNYLTVQDWIDSQHLLVDEDSARLFLVSLADGSSRRVTLVRWAGRHVTVSPDGRYVAYTAGLENGKTEVRILKLDSGADTALLLQPADDLVLGWAPDGNKLVFRSNRAGLGSYDVWWVPMGDGRTAGLPERVGPSPEIYRTLGVTQQGSLFYARANDSDEVFISDLDTTDGTLSPPRVLSGRFAGTKTVPIWSPQGASVLFVAGDALHFHDISSGNDRDLKPGVGELKRVAAWSKDGRILFESASGPNGSKGLFRIDAETGEARLILEGRMDDVTLSSDTTILYGQGGPGSKSLISRNLTTGEEKILLTRSRRTDVANLRLRLSPDGRMLAMQLFEPPPGKNSLAIMPVSGSEPHVILQVPAPERIGVGAIAWSPDGRYVYAAQTTGQFSFRDHSEILRIPVNGGPAVSVGPSVQAIVRHLSLSPDGRQVLYESHRTIGEVWALENFLQPAQTRR